MVPLSVDKQTVILKTKINKVNIKIIKWFGMLVAFQMDRFLIEMIIDFLLLLPIRLSAIVAIMGALIALTVLSGKRPKGVRGSLFIMVPMIIGAIGALSFLANLLVG